MYTTSASSDPRGDSQERTAGEPLENGCRAARAARDGSRIGDVRTEFTDVVEITAIENRRNPRRTRVRSRDDVPRAYYFFPHPFAATYKVGIDYQVVLVTASLAETIKCP